MLNRLVGSDTTVAQLKEGLTASSQAMRGIAHRVANAGTPDFAQALEDAQAAGEESVNLEKEMVALDELREELGDVQDAVVDSVRVLGHLLRIETSRGFSEFRGERRGLGDG